MDPNSTLCHYAIRILLDFRAGPGDRNRNLYFVESDSTPNHVLGAKLLYERVCPLIIY